MSARTTLLTLVVLSCIFTGPAFGDGTREERTAELRKAVFEDSSAQAKGAAYRTFFRHVGQTGFDALTKDEDTGLALQAAWEVHKKAVKRPKPLGGGRSDDIYDPAELAKFVEFLKNRTGAPVPEWWAKDITAIDLFPKKGHGFPLEHWPEYGKSKTGAWVPKTARVDDTGGTVTYSEGDRKVEFSKADLDCDSKVDVAKGVGRGEHDGYAGVLVEAWSVIAAYRNFVGWPFSIAGFNGKGGKPVWKAEVWAVPRGPIGGFGYHMVEVRQKGKAVYVFGAEQNGMYVEAFDGPTGKCLFRFSTCYWWSFSEGWGLD
jgi:hypothetical protein